MCDDIYGVGWYFLTPTIISLLWKLNSCYLYCRIIENDSIITILVKIYLYYLAAKLLM